MSNRIINAIEQVLTAWVIYVFRHRQVVIGIIGALTFACGYLAMSRLAVDTDTRKMINPALEYRQQQIAFDEAFPQFGQNITVVMRGESADEVHAFAQLLQSRLMQKNDVIADVYDPRLDPYFRRNGLLFLSVSELEAKLSRISRAAPLLGALYENPTPSGFFDSLAKVTDLARRDGVDIDEIEPVFREMNAVIEAREQGNPRALSFARLMQDAAEPSHSTPDLLVLSVKPKQDFSQLFPARAAADAIRAEIDLINQESQLTPWNIETNLTGLPILRMEELQSVSRGIELSFVISLLLVGSLLLVAFRSPKPAITTVVAIISSLVITAGIATVVVGALNLVSVAFTVLLLGLGVDFAIHLGLHVQERLMTGDPPEKALRQGISEIGAPLALCMPTTVIAFLAFVPTDFAGMAQLGVVASIGVVVAFVVTISLVSANTATAAPTGRLKEPKAHRRRLASMPVRALLALLVVAVGVASLFRLQDVKFDPDPMSLRDPFSASVTAFNWLMDDSRIQPYRLNIVAQSLEEADRIAEDLKAIDKVGRVLTLSSFIPQNQEDKLFLIDVASGALSWAFEAEAAPVEENDFASSVRGLIQNLNAMADQADAATLAQALERLSPEQRQALGHDVMHLWPYTAAQLRASLSAYPVSLTDLPPQLVERYRTPDGRYRVEIVPQEKLLTATDRAAFVAAVTASYPQATGEIVGLVRSSTVVSSAMIQATATALVLVFVFLLIVLQDTTISVLVLLPVLLAAVLTSVIGTEVGLNYNFANVIVLPLLIGLGIDNGIHLGLRARALASGSAVLGTSTPRAILFSTLTTIAAFGSLILSDHRGTASMGALLSLAIGMSLLCSLIVLPVLMDGVIRLRQRCRKKGRTA